MLYSADGLGSLSVFLPDNIQDEIPPDYGLQLTAVFSPSVLVFVDTQSPDYQLIVEDLVASDHATVILIEETESGLDVISNALVEISGLDEIHVISHSDGSGLQLGSDWLTYESLQSNPDIVEGWARSLNDNADVLFYGCNLAGSEGGNALLDLFADLTGADVAASDDSTGHPAFDGDWELENKRGVIEAKTIISEDFSQDWHHSLASINVTTTDDVVNPADGVTSLREAITQANLDGAPDVIQLPVGNFAFSTANSSTQYEILSDISIIGSEIGVTLLDASNLDRHFYVHPSGDILLPATPNFTLENLTLKNGNPTINTGGAILIEDSDMTMREVIFDNNHSNSSGGAISVRLESDVTIYDSLFENNSSDGFGGAVFSGQPANVAIFNTDFVNNESGTGENDGGAIHVGGNGDGTDLNGSNVTIQGGSFDSNVSHRHGGAIMVHGQLSLNGTTFNQNSATNGGAIFQYRGDNLDISSVSFTGNTANNGGALYLDKNQTAEIRNSSFTGNTTAGAGGAIHSETDSYATIVTTSFSDNVSGSSGGAIQSYAAGIDLDNSNFTNNSSTTHGGAINTTLNSLLEITDVTFTSNKSINSHGGALYNGGESFIDTTIFSANNAKGSGGAIFNSAVGQLNLQTSSLISNSSDSNGGAIVNQGSATINGSLFESNSTDNNGGAIQTGTGSAQLELHNSLLIDNTAQNGAGIALFDSSKASNIDNTTFHSNIAEDIGGAVGLDGGELTVSNTTFFANDADITGGAIGKISDTTTKHFVTNSIFAQNTSNNGEIDTDGLYSNGFNVFEAVSLTFLNDIGDIKNANILLQPLADNGGPVHTMALGVGSDAIDAGMGPPKPDATGQMSNEFVDAGAYEHRLNQDLRKIFWTNGSAGEIYRANEAGDAGDHALSAIQKIVDTEGAPNFQPEDIEYNPTDNRIYWTINGRNSGVPEGAVWSSSTDGTGEIELLTNATNPEILRPHGIALDIPNQKLYLTADWLDGNHAGTSSGNKIVEYQINTTGLLELKRILHEATHNSTQGPTASARDIEYASSIVTNPARTLAWSDRGEAPFNENIAFYDIDTDTHLGYIDPLDPVSNIGVPQGISFNADESVIFLTDDVTLKAFNVTTENITSTLTSTNNLSGVQYDNLHDKVWYTEIGSPSSKSGMINIADSDLSNPIQIELVQAPTALAFSTINHIDIAPVLVNNETLGVNQGTGQMIRNPYLLTTDTDTDNKDIRYDVSLPPMEGYLYLSPFANDPVIEFTQMDIDDEILYYKHTGTSLDDDTFTFTVSDGNTTLGPFDFQLDVLSNNQAPTAQDGSIILDEGDSTDAVTNFLGDLTTDLNDLVTDPDISDTHTFSLFADGTTGSATVTSNGAFSYQHNDNEIFSDTFQYLVQDNNGGQDVGTIAVNIHPLNDNTPIGSADVITVEEGGTISVPNATYPDLLSNDSDNDILPAYTLTATLDTPPSQTQGNLFSLNPDGSFTYTHSGVESTGDSFTYTVSDGLNSSVPVQVSIELDAVNDNNPYRVNNVPLTVIEDGTAPISSIELKFADDDLPQEQLDYTVSRAPAHGFLSHSGVPATPITQFTQADLDAGNVSYTHIGDEQSGDSFEFVVSDGLNATGPHTFLIELTSINDNAPVADNGTIIIDEGLSTSVVTNSANFVKTTLADLVTDLDLPNDNLNFSIQSPAHLPEHGNLVVNPDGTFTYTHDDSENFSDSFTYTVTDDNGASDTGDITISINAQNDNAPLANTDSIMVDEGETVTTLDTGLLSVIDNDTDEDLFPTIPPVAILDLAPVHDANTFILNPDGTFSYKHDDSENFSDSFSYHLFDGVFHSDPVDVQIVINEKNDNFPVIPPAAIELLEGSSTSSFTDGRTNLLVGVTDEDVGDTRTIANVTQPTHGQITSNAAGDFVYAHDGSEPDQPFDNFEYTVVDEANQQTSTVVQVNIVPVNDPPSSAGSQLPLEEDSVYALRIEDFNFNDPEEGHSLQSVIITGLPQHGILTKGNEIIEKNDQLLATDITAGLIIYSPPADFLEPVQDVISFLVVDSGGVQNGGQDTSQNSADIIIDLQPVNDAPTATQLVDNQTTAEILPFSYALPATLFNDADEDVLTLSATSSNGNALPGWLTFDPINAVFSGTPTPDDIGIIPVTVSASDNQGAAAATVSFTIEVLDINDPPTDISLQGTTVSETSNGEKIGTLSVSDPDAWDTSVITVDDTRFEVVGSELWLSNDVQLDFETEPSIELTFTATDTGDNAISETIVISVLDENEAPHSTTAIEDFIIPENIPFDFFLAQDLFSDPDGDTLILTALQADGSPLPQWLVFSPDTGSFSGIPGPEDIGIFDLVVSADDQRGANPATVSFSIEVFDINDAPTDIALSNSTISESAEASVVSTLTVFDPDQWDTSSITVNDPRFEVINGELWLTAADLLDHETEPQINLLFTATDTGNNIIDVAAIVTVSDANDAPVATYGDTEAFGAAPVSMVLPLDYFTDPDGDAVMYTATQLDGTPLPAWISFNPVTLEIVLSEFAPNLPTFAIALTGSDANGGSTTVEHLLVLEPPIGSAQTIEPAPATDTINVEEKEETDTEEDAENNRSDFPDPEDLDSETKTGPAAEQLQKLNNLQLNQPSEAVGQDVYSKGRSSAAKTETNPEEPTLGAALPSNINLYRTPISSLINPADLDFESSRAKLVETMDKQRDELNDERMSIEFVDQTSATLSAGVSVGYIAWLLRGGVLLGSVLSTLPAWRTIDPLPVLASMSDGEDDYSDDESLQTIVDKSQDNHDTSHEEANDPELDEHNK